MQGKDLLYEDGPCCSCDSTRIVFDQTKREPVRLRVYVAGPYTADPEHWIEKALDVGDRLLEAGHYPYIPHLAHLWEQWSPKDYDTWIALGIEYLRICHAMFRIPGPSPGADLEVEQAAAWQIPVFGELEAFSRWAAKYRIAPRVCPLRRGDHPNCMMCLEGWSGRKK